MPANFTFQDISGILLALCLYPFIFVFPGYLTGWSFNLFGFRSTASISQIVMAMSISASIVPSGLFLIHRFGSSTVAISLLLLMAVAAVYIFAGSYKKNIEDGKYIKLSMGFVLLWIFLSIAALVDLQIGDRLYFSTNSYDFTTRVSVVDAITRSGVPPVNPSYYPGQPVLLHSLYYFWYILVSVVDQMGGEWVSAYQAMIASVSWAGLVLFAALATYLHARDNLRSKETWRKSFLAMQLIAIGGLDFIMLLVITAGLNFQFDKLPFQGLIEGWNMPIMSWMNALAWVPHHLVAALACMPTILITAQHTNRRLSERVPDAIFIGLAFASAFGLSVWVMFVFAIFWVLWLAQIILKEKRYQVGSLMIFGALLGVLFVLPFIGGILQGGGYSSAAGGLPISLYVRPFRLVSLFVGSPSLLYSVMNFLFLPLNYLFELGFFFLIATLWFRDVYKAGRDSNPIFRAEVLLFLVSFVLLSFVYSTIIAINDLGIRGWLPLQFILVVWAVDVICRLPSHGAWISPDIFNRISGSKILPMALGMALLIGYLTTALEVIALRGWPILADMKIVSSTGLSPDSHLGERTFSARLAYNYLRDHINADAIVQNNPVVFLDRASGLYGNHQMAISDRTIYGVPLDVYYSMADDVGMIFTRQDLDWDFVDAKCSQYFINYIIVNDTDPLWVGLHSSQNNRSAMYMNNHYQIYRCGSNEQ
jgi:hypothetical protein